MRRTMLTSPVQHDSISRMMMMMMMMMMMTSARNIKEERPKDKGTVITAISTAGNAGKKVTSPAVEVLLLEILHHLQPPTFLMFDNIQGEFRV